MLIQLISHAIDINKATNYVAGKAEIVDGNPDIFKKICSLAPANAPYTPFCISFAPGEVSKAQALKIAEEIKADLTAGIAERDTCSITALHTDKDHLHLHFYIANYNLATQKPVYFYIHKRDINYKDELQHEYNERYNLAKPTDRPRLTKPLSKTEMQMLKNIDDSALKIKIMNGDKAQICAILEAEHEAGEFKNREDIMARLEQIHGVKIVRQGEDYISINYKNSPKNIRLKGYLFNKNYHGKVVPRGKPRRGNFAQLKAIRIKKLAMSYHKKGVKKHYANTSRISKKMARQQNQGGKFKRIDDARKDTFGASRIAREKLSAVDRAMLTATKSIGRFIASDNPQLKTITAILQMCAIAVSKLRQQQALHKQQQQIKAQQQQLSNQKSNLDLKNLAMNNAVKSAHRDMQQSAMEHEQQQKIRPKL